MRNPNRLGAGTGLFTRSLLSHPTFGVAVRELQAVEPSQGMREVFQERTRDDRVSVREGSFEHTGSPDGWADLVVVAQAWHWCPDFEKAIVSPVHCPSKRGLRQSGSADGYTSYTVCCRTIIFELD